MRAPPTCYTRPVSAGHRRLPAATLTALVWLQSSCFKGDDARGLPCRIDDDCGVGQSCIGDFCDGPPPTECGDGVLDHDEGCDDGDQNGDNARCKADCTPNMCGDGALGPEEACDDGDLNDDRAACKSDCTVASCGDGIVGPDEACDEGADNGPGRPCKSDCRTSACGDGTVDPGEDCDPGGETAECNVDCSSAMCGDGTLNPTAGEACDDGNGSDDDDCLSDCARVVFRDHMDDGVGNWTHEVVDGAIGDGWQLQQDRAASAPAAWHSGTVPDQSGSTRLISPRIDLASVSGPIRLRFVHWWSFDDCGDPDFAPDGARIEISVGDDPFEPVDPITPYPDALDADMICTDPNPLASMSAWGHDSADRFEPSQFDLDAYAGESIRIGFRVASDCNECDPAEGWYIDDVVLSAF